MPFLETIKLSYEGRPFRAVFLTEEPFHSLGEPSGRIGEMTAGIHLQGASGNLFILLQASGLQLCFILDG